MCISSQNTSRGQALSCAQAHDKLHGPRCCRCFLMLPHAPPFYIQATAEATQAAKGRNQYFKRATEAFHRGNKAVPESQLHAPLRHHQPADLDEGDRPSFCIQPFFQHRRGVFVEWFC